MWPTKNGRRGICWNGFSICGGHIPLIRRNRLQYLLGHGDHVTSLTTRDSRLATLQNALDKVMLLVEQRIARIHFNAM